MKSIGDFDCESYERKKRSSRHLKEGSRGKMVCDIGNMKNVEIVINEKVSLITMYDKVPRKLKTRHFIDVKLDR